ncbi:helix-turn-helix domain-containing protein [Boseaceae bacterium BT-24-1]|nr:helix-turn-helix domain-containing protein [Boseaceae bacterium BT-24-1]
MDPLARLEAVLAENERLRDRIAALEDAFGMNVEAPVFLGLTASEARLFGALMKRDTLTKGQIMSALYVGRMDGEEAEIKIVDVFVCKIRKKLKPYGLTIETLWGQGYRISPAMKTRAAAIMQENAA